MVLLMMGYHTRNANINGAEDLVTGFSTELNDEI